MGKTARVGEPRVRKGGVMKKTKEVAKAGGISSAAVQKATGKTWTEWCASLDAAGAAQMTHQEIVAGLVGQGVGGWWRQMVAVGYEQERGLRSKNMSCKGEYQASASKTLGVPLSRLYKAWGDAKVRSGWLTDNDFTVRKATPNKSMRITWIDGHSSVEVNFYAKGENKSQVTVQHSKLADSKHVMRVKKYWGEALARLEQLVTS